MRKMVLGILLVAAFIFVKDEARAQCDCFGTPETGLRSNKTALEELEHSEVVFIGEVLKRDKVKIANGDYGYEYVLTYKVKRAWKKEMEETVEVREGGPCLLGFTKGDEVIVYAILYKGSLRQPYCSRTRELSKAAADLKEFEQNGVREQTIRKMGNNP